MVRAAVTRPRAGQITLTERVDRIATHACLGTDVAPGSVGRVFWLTYSIGAPLQGWLNEYLVLAGAKALGAALRGAGAPWWIRGLLTDGIVAGAGYGVHVSAYPASFLCGAGLLEDVGYMARAAYITDRFMHWIGLHGKSFLPLCLGMGCNVPGVLCTRHY